ncbi:unnamed protein product, partial [marine sediment metagenome]
MRSIVSALIAALLLGLMCGIAAADDEKGGLSGLGGMFGTEPDHKDEGLEGKGPAAPAGGGEKPKPEPEPPEAGPTLEDHIAGLEKQIEGMKKGPPKDQPRITTAEEAEKAVKALRETHNRAMKNLDMADREKTRQAAERLENFDERWNERLAKIHKDLTVDDLRKGRKPPDVDPAAWASAYDQFASEHAALEAELAETAQKLSAKRKRQLRPLNDELKRAEEWAKQWREHPDIMPKTMQREMNRRTHQA